MLIRPLDPADRAALGALLAPVFAAGETYSAPQDLDPEGAAAWWTAPGKSAFVAVSAAGLLGSYYIRPNAEGPGVHVCICGYVTAEHAHGLGVASAMLEHSLSEAVRLGFRAMQFNAVVATNAGAIRLWRRAGFAVIGRTPEAFRHPTQGYVDTLIMHKTLGDAAQRERPSAADA